MAARKKKVFRDLFAYNVDKYIMLKSGVFKAKYISWPDAWALLKLEVPDATFHTYECPKSGMPYFVSPDGCGAMVKVGVTVNGIEIVCWQPITDNNKKGKKLQQITSSDIGNTEKRALVKAIGMHGLGLQLWSKLERQLFELEERVAANLEAMSNREPPNLDVMVAKPAKSTEPHHASFDDEERKSFFAMLAELGHEYEDLCEFLEAKGAPRPTQMDQEKRNAWKIWLKAGNSIANEGVAK